MSSLGVDQLCEYAWGPNRQVYHLLICYFADVEVHTDLFDHYDGFDWAHLFQLFANRIADLKLVNILWRQFKKLLTKCIRVSPRLRLIKFKLLLRSIVIIGCGRGEPTLVRRDVGHVGELAFSSWVTEVYPWLFRLIRVNFHELLKLAADDLILCLGRLLRLRQLGIHLFEAKVLLHAAMIVVQQLLGLGSMILTIFKVIEAWDLRFKSGLNGRILL